MAANPSNTKVLMMLGTMYQAKGDSAGAEKTFKQVLQLEPDNPVAANNIAFAMLQRGDNVDMALSLAQTARKGLPNVASTADTLALAYFKKGAYRSAIDLLENALKQDPANPEMRYHL